MSFTPTLNESLAHGWTVVRVALRKLSDAWITEALEAADFLSARFSRPAAIRLIAEIGPYGVGIEAISRSNASTWRKQVAWASYSRELIDEGLNEASMSSTTRGLTLRLPAENFLFGSFQAPHAGSVQIRGLIAELLSRKTPFASKDVLFGYELETGPGNRPRVRFAAIKQTTLEEAFSRLGVSQSEVVDLEAPAPEGARAIHVQLRRPRVTPLKSIAVVGIGAIAFFVAAIALGAFLANWRLKGARERIDREIGLVSSTARELIDKMQLARETGASLDELIKARGSAGVIQTWEELARALPETAWLTELRIEGGKAFMSGLAASASELPTILMKSDLFSDVSLSGPLVADATLGKQRFSLEAAFRRPAAIFEKD